MRLAHRLAHAHVNFAVCAFVFWICQLVAWVAMVVYVQFFNPKLGNNVLYVTQISHWALVLSCGTAATATLGVITTRQHSRPGHHDPDEIGVTTTDDKGNGW